MSKSARAEFGGGIGRAGKPEAGNHWEHRRPGDTGALAVLGSLGLMLFPLALVVAYRRERNSALGRGRPGSILNADSDSHRYQAVCKCQF